MGLLSTLTQRLKFWWKPVYTLNYSYKVVDYWLRDGTKYFAFYITLGKFKGNQFALSNIEMTDLPNEEGNLSFDVEHINGYTHRDVVHQVVMDFLKWSIDNYNETHKAVLNDDTEDSRTDYIEEPVNERRVCKASASVSKE